MPPGRGAAETLDIVDMRFELLYAMMAYVLASFSQVASGRDGKARGEPVRLILGKAGESRLYAGCEDLR